MISPFMPSSHSFLIVNEQKRNACLLLEVIFFFHLYFSNSIQSNYCKNIRMIKNISTEQLNLYVVLSFFYWFSQLVPELTRFPYCTM